MHVYFTKTFQRFGGAANRTIIANAGSVVGTTASTSALGFMYWWLAARLFMPAAVGLAGATVSAMTLLGTVGMLGFGTLLIGELPNRPGKEFSLIGTLLVVSGLAGTVLGLLFALIAPHLSENFHPLTANAINIALFALGVGIASAAQVLDQALIGLLRGSLQFWRNTFFAIAKLALLFVVARWLAATTGLTIYATWAIGNGISLVVLIGLALLKRGQFRSYRPEWVIMRQLGPAALKHHGLNLALQGASFALPIMVTGILSAEANAYFYTAWMVVGFVFVVPLALTTALYAVGTRSPAALAHKLRFTLGLAMAGGILANVVLFFVANPLLSIFRPEYGVHAATTLRILGLAVFPIIVKDHYVAIHRIYGRVTKAALFVAIGGLFELAMATIGARLGGLSGLAVAWVVAGCVQAVLLAPVVYRVARQQELAVREYMPEGSAIDLSRGPEAQR